LKVVFRNVSREYAGRWVLQGVSFELNGNPKVGLIGANGSGKTTILRILCGSETPSDGSVELSGDVRIGYVPQHIEYAEDETVYENMLREHQQLEVKLRAKEHAVTVASSDEMDRSLKEYQQVRDAYDLSGGDHFQQRAEAMLETMGLEDKIRQKIGPLSGGEKNVLTLTKALLAEPNLLILDEPGNHLDYVGLAWLDDFLQRFRGAVLIVSHNRYLLDRIAGGIVELENGKVRQYRGNYSAYRQQRQERLHSQQMEYKAYQQRVAHLEALVRKFADIAQGHASDQSWGKRLRARRTQLEREKSRAVEKPVTQHNKISPDFQTEPTQADIALQLRGYSKSFDQRKLLQEVDWNVGGAERWALVGPNGCGKTTLLRDIVNYGHWEHGVIRIGPSLSIGYCAQQQEVLDGDNTVFEELVGIKGAAQEQVLAILARFLFKDEEVHKKVSQLSGGERNRLQLARLMLLKPNFLILDEPTNHLDIPTREAVEEALSEFKGTLIVVSHDRYFLDKVTNHVAEVSDGNLKLYSGNFTFYWQSRQAGSEKITGRISSRGKSRRQTPTEKPKRGGQQWLQRKAATAQQRKARKIIAQLEQEIADTEQQKNQLTDQVTAAFTNGDHQQGHELSQKLENISSRLDALYRRWMEAAPE
jgi:ATP-binding cassette subfamily F protein 3